MDGTMHLWDLEARQQLHSFTGHTDVVLCVAFAPDGRHAISGSADRTLRLWDLPA
jgi:WD40 repeat protein